MNSIADTRAFPVGVLRRMVLVALCCLPLLVLAAAEQTAEPEYTVGVVPQFDARRIHAVWRPILDALEQRTGLRFTLRGSPTIPEFEREFRTGAFDFAYMNPYHLHLAHEQQGYLPLVRDTGRQLHGILVVRKDSTLTSPAALAGEEVAFPAPNALGATLLVRAELMERFGIDVVPRFVQSHSSVYLNVALGQTVAGGGVLGTLEQQPEAVRQALRIVHRTAPVPGHPFVAHLRIPADVRQQVTDALMALATTDAGKAMLAKVPMHRVGPTRLDDYNVIRQLGLDRYHKVD